MKWLSRCTKHRNSFTRENSVEIGCHGSPLIVQRIIALCLREGAHLAGPGEFTRRAFLNGRFDLAQAEAVADLINLRPTMPDRHSTRCVVDFRTKSRKLREEFDSLCLPIELRTRLR